MARLQFDPSKESGSALMQVVLVSGLIGIISYILIQFTVRNDQSATRWIQRTTNINMGANLATYVNDRTQLGDVVATPAKDAANVAIKYP